MSPQIEKMRWTTADLDLFPDTDTRYETIDGELFVTRAPHWKHQRIADNICLALKLWSQQTGLGQAVTAPGIVFTDADNVIPDVVWVTNQRLETILDEAGYLTGAPELIVEDLSPGEKQEQRDKKLKLKLYSVQGVHEYWIVDRLKQQLEIYRREKATLKLAATLFIEDCISSPLLPEWSYLVSSVFA
ncbi:MAG: Uma2 family endonuclease [Cyanophyceae cyanobacterium]